MSDYDTSDNDLEDGNIDWGHSAIGDIEDLNEDLMMQESEYEDEQDCNAFFPKMTARTYRARIQHLTHDNTSFFCYNFADELGEGGLREWGCFSRAALVWIESIPELMTIVLLFSMEYSVYRFDSTI
jgi:hypothetical protein